MAHVSQACLLAAAACSLERKGGLAYPARLSAARSSSGANQTQQGRWAQRDHVPVPGRFSPVQCCLASDPTCGNRMQSSMQHRRMHSGTPLVFFSRSSRFSICVMSASASSKLITSAGARAVRQVNEWLRTSRHQPGALTSPQETNGWGCDRCPAHFHPPREGFYRHICHTKQPNPRR